VAELRPDDAAHWVTATAAPCTSLFKPVQVTSPVDLAPQPSDCYHPAALWWRHEEPHRTVMRDPAAAHPLFGPERDAVQARWLAAPPSPAAAFAEADELLAGWTAAVTARITGRDTRPAWARRYWQKRNTRAGLPSQAALRARASTKLSSSAPGPAVTADVPALLPAESGSGPRERGRHPGPPDRTLELCRIRPDVPANEAIWP
jgi:hypothetical protein